jgi:hypothetical protein
MEILRAAYREQARTEVEISVAREYECVAALELRMTRAPHPQRYNIRVPHPAPQDDRKQRRRAVYASETTGLLVIAVLLLILTLIRYWHHIHWSLR